MCAYERSRSGSHKRVTRALDLLEAVNEGFMSKRDLVHNSILSIGLAAGLFAQTDRVPAGAEISVRTIDTIDANSPSDYRVFRATVERNVSDTSGRVAIPRGSEAELIMRDASRDSIVLDLESVVVNGRRYAVSSTAETVTSDASRKEGVGANQRTGKYVGGGALIGTIIGAIAGGGKGAAIGAATGAGAGAVGQTVTRGGRVRLPSESILTFRLDRPLMVDVADTGFMRDGQHYHRYDRNQYERDGRP
jgi:hypothetical protein